jgi:hypothetical protein
MKNILFLISAMLVLSIACKKTEDNEMLLKDKVLPKVITKIGDVFQSGLVFYVDSTGQHGLICALKDQIIPKTGIQWYNGTYTATGATGTVIGTGNANTIKIATIQGAGGYAVKICDNWVSNDDGYLYSDWYLPSINELQLMHKNLFSENLGNFDLNGSYWSSTEKNATNAMYIWFGDGAIKDIAKSWTGGVRAIRSF